MSNFFDNLKITVSQSSEDKEQAGKTEGKGKGDSKKNTSKVGATLNNLLIIFLVGVLLVLVGSIFKQPASSPNKGGATAVAASDGTEVMASNNNNGSSAVSASYKKEMQDDLVDTLEKIEGVGKVHAMIYFESGTEQITVFDEDTSKSITNEDDSSGGQRSIEQENGGTKVVMQTEDNKQKPFVTKTNNPKITGVCVVAEGASDNITELRIRQAVTGLFGLDDINVQVYPMAK